MMSLTFGLFTQVGDSGPLGPLVFIFWQSVSCRFPLKLPHCEGKGFKISQVQKKISAGCFKDYVYL